MVILVESGILYFLFFVSVCYISPSAVVNAVAAGVRGYRLRKRRQSRKCDTIPGICDRHLDLYDKPYLSTHSYHPACNDIRLTCFSSGHLSCSDRDPGPLAEVLHRDSDDGSGPADELVRLHELVDNQTELGYLPVRVHRRMRASDRNQRARAARDA